MFSIDRWHPEWAIPPAALALALAALVSPIAAQADAQLSLGDVVRVDYDFVGTLMSIDNATTLTVLGEGEQRCTAGLMHGDAPRCDPAPAVRRVVDWRSSTIEIETQPSYKGAMALGALIGAVVGAPLGYVTGPSLGYGAYDGCVVNANNDYCADPIEPAEFEELQRSQDQKRGAIFWSVVGATVGAIAARTTVDRWLVISPPQLGDGGGVSLSLNLPAGSR